MPTAGRRESGGCYVLAGRSPTAVDCLMGDSVTAGGSEYRMAGRRIEHYGENAVSKTKIDELQSLVAKLRADREAHVDAITEIDVAFDKLGLTMPKAKRRGRKGKKTVAAGRFAEKKTTKRAKRRKFRVTANELVLATIRKAGPKGGTGAQISKAWKAAGRTGDAYNTLGGLVKEKKIKREKIKGAKGSVYRLS